MSPICCQVIIKARRIAGKTTGEPSDGLESPAGRFFYEYSLAATAVIAGVRNIQ